MPVALWDATKTQAILSLSDYMKKKVRFKWTYKKSDLKTDYSVSLSIFSSAEYKRPESSSTLCDFTRNLCFHSRFPIRSHQRRNRKIFQKLGHTLNRFCDGSIYVQIKYDKCDCAIVCNEVGKGFTMGSFRFDQTQIFHAWPVNFAYYERVK